MNLYQITINWNILHVVADSFSNAVLLYTGRFAITNIKLIQEKILIQDGN